MTAFKTEPIIICPKCKRKQKGIIQFIDHIGDEEPDPGDVPISVIIPFIRCEVKKCGYIIHSDEFNEITKGGN